MKRIHLLLEFDGSRYGGWQRQDNSLTVQEVVEDALATVVGQRVTVVSSGRTDAGVHALGMSVHCTVSRVLPITAYREGLNRLLPEDIVVRNAREVAPDFHARYSARAKWYRYLLHTGKVRPAMHRLRCWHIRAALDFEEMRKAAGMICGEHDFRAFTVASCNASTTVRRVDTIQIDSRGDFVIIDVTGNGFLRYMVRRIAGTLVEVGSNRRSFDSITQMLQHPHKHSAGVTAPAHGLCLMQVLYAGEDLDFSENFP